MNGVCVVPTGHDGLVILWDILAGLKLKTLQLEVRVPCQEVCM